MAAEYKPEDKNQVKSGAKKLDDSSSTPAGKPAPEAKSEVKQRTQREMDAGKRALERRKAEATQVEEK